MKSYFVIIWPNLHYLYNNDSNTEHQYVHKYKIAKQYNYC